MSCDTNKIDENKMFNLDFLLPGHYKLETSENFSSYLEAMGVESKVLRKAAETAPVRYRFLKFKIN